MKGSLVDIPFICVMLLVGAITIFIVFLIVSTISSAWPIAGESKTILSAGVNSFLTFDYMLVFFGIGLGIFTIISGFMIDSHPILFVFSALILLPISIFLAAQITNIFNEIAITDAFTPVANQFPYTMIFMRSLPLFCLAIGIMTAIAVHGKPGGGSGI